MKYENIAVQTLGSRAGWLLRVEMGCDERSRAAFAKRAAL